MSHFATVFLAASVVLGQASDNDKGDDFRKLRAFAGSWEAEIEAEGEKLRVPISARPILDGRFYEQRWIALNQSGELVASGIEIIGRDPSDNKLKFWGFGSEGFCSQLTLVEWDGEKSIWNTRETEADGTKKKGKVTFEFLDRNNYTWTLKYDDGEDLHGTFKRTKQKEDLWPKVQLEIPEGASEQLKAIAWWTGNGTTEGSDAFTGKTTVGQSRCGWILGGKFLLYDTAFVDSDLVVGQYRAIIGVDPSTNRTTGWEFESTGTVGKYTAADKGQDIVGRATSPQAGALEFRGKMTQTASGSDYKAKATLPDDKEVSYHGIWTKTKSGEE